MSDDRRGTDGGEHPLDVEARFADIVAHFHDGETDHPRIVDASAEAAAGSTGRPGGPDEGTDVVDLSERSPDGAAERGVDRDDTVHGGADPTAEPAPDPRRGIGRPSSVTGARHLESREERLARIEAEIDRAVDGPDGGHFVPPEPPPIPRPDLPHRLAWTGVLLGPVLLVVFALLWRDVPQWVVGALASGIVAGFGYLVWRLPRTRDRDDPDDGAIV